MKVHVEITDESVLSLNDSAYVSNTLTQEDNESDFKSVDDINLTMLYKNIVKSSDDNKTVLNSPYTNKIYYKNGDQMIKYDKSFKITDTSLITDASSDNVECTIENAYKAFNEDFEFSLDKDMYIIYKGKSQEFTRFKILGSGSFKILGSVDDEHYVTISIASSDDEKAKIKNGTIQNIEVPGEFKQYKIIALENSKIKRIKFFGPEDDILFMGNLNHVYSLSHVLSLNNYLPEISEIENDEIGTNKRKFVFYYKDKEFTARTINTVINFPKDSEIIEYEANVCKDYSW